MNRLTCEQGLSLGVEAAKRLCRGGTTYRAFQEAGAGILTALPDTLQQVRFYSVTKDGRFLTEEVALGLDEGQGQDQLPLDQLPRELSQDLCPVRRPSGARRCEFTAPIVGSSGLIGILVFVVFDPDDELLSGLAAVAEAIAPAVEYVLYSRHTEDSLRLFQAATRLSRDLAEVELGPDGLLSRFVALIVEHLGFDRATLFVYGPNRRRIRRAICALYGREPFELPATSFPRVPSLGPDPKRLRDIPGVWIPIDLGSRRLGALLADNLITFHPLPEDMIPSLIDLTGQVALGLENARLLERTREMALRDDLTGLFRPGYFRERVQEELGKAEREGYPIGMIVMDLDGFKAVNDTFGHAAGDQVLIQVARLAREVLRSSDVVCRMGGDEFALMLPGASLEEATNVAERLLDAVREHRFEVGGDAPVSLSASLGVAVYPRDAGDWQTLLEQADRAMYLSKRDGKGKVSQHPAPSGFSA